MLEMSIAIKFMVRTTYSKSISKKQMGNFCVHSLVSTMLGMFQNNMTKRFETLSKIKDAS
jgi:hypothetical protein